MRHPQEITGSPGQSSDDFEYIVEPYTVFMALETELEAIKSRQTLRAYEMPSHATINWRTRTTVLNNRRVENVDIKGELL